jgi:23S rRNA (adenine2503-C2)-methyltransferase
LLRGALRFGHQVFATAGERGLSLGRQVAESLERAAIVPLSTRVAGVIRSPDGAVKLALRLHDDLEVETVVLSPLHGHSVCISTQAGCPVGCTFCASGIAGLGRNLSAGEIAEQVAHARRHAAVDRVVVMGMGEPTLNLENLLRALATIKNAAGIGERRVIISTIGIPGRIAQLTELAPRYTIALSLHSARDEVRRRLIPRHCHPVREILEATRAYVLRSTRACLIEITLLRGINDGAEEAEALIEALRGLKACVNLIPWNPVPGLPHAAPERESLEQMQGRLVKAGLHTTIRRSLGPTIDAACGQLARRITSPAFSG